jgi:hypothetical protein
MPPGLRRAAVTGREDKVRPMALALRRIAAADGAWRLAATPCENAGLRLTAGLWAMAGLWTAWNCRAPPLRPILVAAWGAVWMVWNPPARAPPP